MEEQKTHILEILNDIVAMDGENITEIDLIQSAKHYNQEFDYNLSEMQLNDIVKKTNL